jgi:small subunit ribosomal protein S6
MDITPKSFANEYETTFILKPELSEGECKKAVEKVVGMIKDAGGKVHNIEHWGVRRLAYPIQRKTNGYYAFIEFSAMSEFIENLERNYRYDDNVLRYLTVKLERHALEFNQKRRDQEFGLRKDAKTSKA